MLIEAYGKGGIVPWLVETYSIEFLEKLLSQTLEFRRDPEEREREQFEVEREQWLEENKDKDLVFVGENGEKEVINLSMFDWSEE